MREMSTMPDATAPRAFARLKANRWKIARTTANERVAKLKKFREVVIRRRGEIAAALHKDFKKPHAETEITETLIVLQELNDAIAHTHQWMKPRKVSTPMTLFGTSSEIRYEPRGVVLILAPWNYPFQLAIAPLVAAVAAGNVAVVKPSEKTPATSKILKELVAEVFPEDEVAVLEGDATVAQSLLEQPFDHIFFTGSTQIGKVVMAAAAKTLATVTLELGGKSPTIVDASADIDETAHRIAWGKLINGGQTCVAPDYVLVHQSKEKALLEALKAKIAELYGSSDEARKSCEDFCRIIDARALSRLKSMMEDAIKRGAKVAIGGHLDEAQNYLAPTVIADVPKDAAIMKEEIFGPLLPVIPFASVDEACDFVNQGDKPLALYVFARDEGAIERILSGTSAGGTVVNNTVIHLANPNLPFGGVGASGQGSYHGEFGFRTFSHERAVLTQGFKNWSTILYPPYGGMRIKRVLAAVRRIVG